MHLKEWIAHHRKKLSLAMGSLLVIAAAVMLYWDNTGDTVLTEEEAYAAKVSAMEARMSGGSQTPPPPPESPIMKAYKEKQAEHIRYTLIVMVIAGAGFLIYGMMKKKEE